MSDLVPVGTTEEIPPRASKVLVHEEKSLAIFNVDGDYFAIRNQCPHAAGPLGRGLSKTAASSALGTGGRFPSSRKTRRTTASRAIASSWMENRYASNSPRSSSTKSRR